MVMLLCLFLELLCGVWDEGCGDRCLPVLGFQLLSHSRVCAGSHVAFNVSVCAGEHNQIQLLVRAAFRQHWLFVSRSRVDAA
jgi:hypothetical protein